VPGFGRSFAQDFTQARQGIDGRWQPGSHRHGWPVAVVLLPTMSTTPDEVGSTGGAGGAESAPPPALTSDPPELEGQSDGAGGGGGLSQRRPRTNDTSKSGEGAGMSLSPTDGSGDAFSPDTVKQMVQHLSPRSRDDDGERCQSTPPPAPCAPARAHRPTRAETRPAPRVRSVGDSRRRGVPGGGPAHLRDGARARRGGGGRCAGGPAGVEPVGDARAGW